MEGPLTGAFFFGVAGVQTSNRKFRFTMQVNKLHQHEFAFGRSNGTRY